MDFYQKSFRLFFDGSIFEGKLRGCNVKFAVLFTELILLKCALNLLFIVEKYAKITVITVEKYANFCDLIVQKYAFILVAWLK